VRKRSASYRDEDGRNGRASGRGSPWSSLTALALGLAALVWTLSILPWPRPALDRRSGLALAAVATWGYQLQQLDIRAIPGGIDLMVVDYSRDGSDRRELSREAVDELRRRPGRPRIVLAYLSVGEAESYRYYWRTLWSALPPTWLGPENSVWKGNFAVRYWEAGWQSILLAPHATVLARLLEQTISRPKGYVDRILEAGFDGIYLDRVDAFEIWKSERPSAEQDMVALVEAISRHAKSRRPGFLVVPQNGEELLAHAPYRRAIDAVAKEGLLFGLTGPEEPNGPDEVRSSLRYLEQAKASRLPVFVVEYVRNEAKREQAAARMANAGFRLLFATRELNLPPELPRAAP
jgi:cysteinyl-tRNA synthetase